MVKEWVEATEKHLDTLEAIAKSETLTEHGIQLQQDVRTLLIEYKQEHPGYDLPHFECDVEGIEW